LGWHRNASQGAVLSLGLALSSEGRGMLNIERADRKGSLLWCVGACALPLLSACTLTADAFSPQLLSSGGDAGSFTAPDAASVASVPEADGLGCSRDDAESAIGSGASCAGAIGLLAPTEDAGAAAPALEPLSLPPCDGELGEFGEPELVQGLDFDDNVFGPALSLDGRTLYFSAYADGEQQIYSATRSRRGGAFSDVAELRAVNSNAMDGTPFLAANGGRFYLFSERQAGLGNRDIWFSEVGSDGEMSEPELVAGVNSPSSELLPWLSADERTMLFVSNRPGGRGGADLWRATRPSADAEFGQPSNIFELSSNENEGRVVLSGNGRSAFFTSDRDGGRGGPDIYVASRPNLGSPFTNVRNLGELNSAQSELDVMLSSDETELFFASSRGALTELWVSVRSCGEEG
jgi:Tol biopolymer transport system component